MSLGTKQSNFFRSAPISNLNTPRHIFENSTIRHIPNRRTLCNTQDTSVQTEKICGKNSGNKLVKTSDEFIKSLGLLSDVVTEAQTVEKLVKFQL